MRFNKELKIGIKLVQKAIQITEWFRKKGFKSFLKSDQSPVTLADFASQNYIISMLKDYFPDDEIIAEEESVDLIDEQAENLINECFSDLNLIDLDNIKENIGFRGLSSERQWTIDPIDGTIGFQEGLPYAVGVGLMINHIPKVCAIGVPNYNNFPFAIFCAEENQGAHVLYNNSDFIQIRVSQEANIEKIRLCHSLHYDKPWVKHFATSIGIKNLIQLDSMKKFCMVADGSADLYLKPLKVDQSFSWDFLPGDLIVKESGGKVTDLNGEKLKFNNKKCIWTAPGIIASNGIVHNKITDFLKSQNLDFFNQK